MSGFGLPPEYRLRSPADFDRVYGEKNRAADGRLLLFGAVSPSGGTRAGSSVSRKYGNSVKRHRLKRRLREAFRLARTDLPQGIDLIMIPQPRVDASVTAYRASLERLAAKIAAKIAGKGSASPDEDQGTGAG